MPALKLPSPPEGGAKPDEFERLKKKLQRERRARVQAEKLLEAKSAELFDASQDLLKQTETAQALAAAIETASDGVATTDVEGRFLYANSAFGDMLGLKPSDIIGQRWTDVYSFKLQRFLTREALPKLARDGGWSGDLIGHTSGYYPLYQELVLNPRAAGGLVFSARDIKRRLARQREIRDLESRLLKAESEAALFTLANAVAHDFNNLLAAIMGHTLLLQSYLDAGSEAELHARQILEATDQAADIIRALDLERNNESHIIEEIDLTKLIRTGVAIVDSIRPPGIQLDLELNEPAIIYANPVLLTRVLINVLRNAFDAMKGRGQLHLRLGGAPRSYFDKNVHFHRLHPFQCENAEFVLEISDNGPGIAPETLTKIFSPFVTTKDRMKGSGLGLLSLTALAESGAATVEVETSLGFGACFRLFFLSNAQTPPSIGQVTDQKDRVD